ncbi:MAG: chromosome segregation protein SMC [Xanthobacteraceae bacterium]|nr:chromosome segregation protein SMC [Xanthobacteraceae bacterium]MCW5673824.1 chromosome segregation protein SMC [Xanthobacteraceae bacterium]
MQFTRLKLLGFKSFVEASEFVIEPGLTGVVGPNGCGKSNIVEALRWAMGESSTKAMRAQDMDQVIFAGSAHRPPRNTAEVVIVVDNADRTAPAQFNDNDILEVSRRIEREAGSAYRINGREVRARDVQLLFADASSGSRSPALVRQGQIGEIINAKPESRRRILEEAAGISGLHARKHEAETRLKAAETNLQRLEDVIGQIATQMDSLKRQARQTVRYKNISGEIRRRQALLMALRWREAEAQIAEAEHTRDLAVRAVADQTKLHLEASRKQTEAGEQLNPAREQAAIAGAGLQRLNLASAELDKEEARAKHRAEELDRRLTQLSADIERERALANDAVEVLARLVREEEALTAEENSVSGGEAAARERMTAAEQQLIATEKAFDEATAELASLVAKRGSLEASMENHRARLAKISAEIEQIEQEAGQGLAENGGELARLREAAAAAHENVSRTDAAVLKAEAARSAAAQALSVARAPWQTAEQNLHRLETEARTLAKMLGEQSKSLFPPAVDQVQVASGYEAALAAALGDELDAPFDASSPMHWAGADANASDPLLPAGVEPLTAQVNAPEALVRSLRQIGVVDRAQGPELRKQLSVGQRLVSKEGDLWRWDGYTVTADAPTAAARRLAARNRLAEIDQEVASAREAVARAKAENDKAQAELTAAETEELNARGLWRNAQSTSDAALQALADAERGAGEHQSRLSALSEARARLLANKTETEGLSAEAASLLASLPVVAAAEAALSALRIRVTNDRAAYASAKADIDGIERERAARAHRLSTIGAERASWREREERAGLQITSIEQRVAETKNERSSLDDAPAKFAEQRNALLTEINAAEAKKREADDKLVAAEQVLADADKAERELRDALSAAREVSARDEARLEAARQRKNDLAREVTEVLGGEPTDERIAEALDTKGAESDPAEVAAKLESLERERERLGAVNLRADEELTEVEKQHIGLTTERDDLVEAIKRLRTGIQSLDKEARERLTASFQTVNEHFKKLFTGLFSGGTAELVLTGSDDPLEAGLDIIAKPPGKKAQSLSLLSGGEQALTAMSLIFAVFLTNPSPICVLDEVDAPLDDSNVERFCGLLERMRDETDTRFITVTHNPITMARMDRLFGVTMAERGVSQLVSVDLQTAQSYREAG